MNTIAQTNFKTTNDLHHTEKEKPFSGSEALAELELGIHSALQTYSNVHRGSGLNSMITTHLYEVARDIVLEYLGLRKGRYVTVFCTPQRAEALKLHLKPGSFKSISSNDIGLSLGVTALAIYRKALPKETPGEAGGGNSRLISPDWVVWAKSPDKFEAGTPAIINVIALAKALNMIRQRGYNPFEKMPESRFSANEILYNDNLEGYACMDLLVKLRQTLIGRNIVIPTLEGESPFINLDNAASTPTFEPVWETFCKALTLSRQEQEEIIREVKSICARFLGASSSSYDIIFTSNTTEAINLVARRLRHEPAADIEPVLLSTLLEHSSNDLPWRLVPGIKIVRLPISKEGFIDREELEIVMQAYNQENRFGSKRITLVAVSGASNVLGVFNNLEEISRIVHRYGARLLVDAAQLAAHRRIEMEACNIDYLAFSAHKMYAPFGCGVLAVKKELLTFSSAEIERINSSGEENIAGIAAMGKALDLLQRIGLDVIKEEEQALTALALQGMAQIRKLRIHGIQDAGSPEFAQKGGVIVFDIKGIISASLAKELALRGIGIRFGCHCAHILVKHLLGVSPGLERFQRILVTLFPKLQLPGLARVSLGIENSKEDIDTLLFALGSIANKLHATKGRHSDSAKDEMLVLSKTEVKKQMKEFVRKAAQGVYNWPDKDFIYS